MPDRAPDASTSGGTAGAAGSTASGGTAGGEGGAGSGGLAGSDAGEAGACAPSYTPCNAAKPCCDGTQCICGFCGIDPACVGVGSACDDVCNPCCSGTCENGVCTSSLDCPMTIEQYCATNSCITTWPSDPTAFCPILSTYGKTATGACTGYLLAYDHGANLGNEWFFDATTGALVAVVYDSQGFPSCLAGPSSFDPPPCDSTTNVDCSDGGAP